MQTYARKDWTPSEKLAFEDVALEYIRSVPAKYQNHRHFDSWLQKMHPDFAFESDIVWSYVLAN